MYTATIPLTNLRRNFGLVEDLLKKVDELTVTKKGKTIATITPAVSLKRDLFKKSAGALKNTELDSDVIWKQATSRRSRKKAIKL